MGVEFGSKTQQQPQRPTSLFLNEGMTSGHQEGGTGLGGIGGGSAAAVKRAGRKKRAPSDARIKKFLDIYETTGETLGAGSFGHVTTYRNKIKNKEYAVKVIEKSERKSRQRVLKEIEIFHHCQGHENILQMVEYFEEDDKFYLVFEKMEGGTLLDCILSRGHLTEREASLVIRDIASGLDFLHKKGIAHRDLKPENILCVMAGQLTPVKICDFDLGSEIRVDGRHCSPITTPELLSPVGSADFMAPEVVDVWQYQAWSYDKRCDLWSLGIILYILLCGRRPFYAHCDNQDCGFDDGEACEDCQELLFKSIQQGVYKFSCPEWDDVSDDAKDLIQHLLVKNPYQRYTAAQVLRHPWLAKESSQALLATPFMLSRNNSVRELGVFAETANAVNRLIQRHLSINEICSSSASPMLTVGEEFQQNDDNNNNTDVEINDLAVSSSLSCGQTSPQERGIFHLGISDEEDIGFGRLSEEDDYEETLLEDMLWMKLSPPQNSSLIKRRTFQLQHVSESSVDSGTASAGASPPE
jgi:MAP kinase interacting serine/threonine kinase